MVQANPPAAASNLVATSVSSSQIDLSWDDNSVNETGFKIQRDEDSDFADAVTLATTAAGATSYSDTPLPPSTLFYYRVLATNGQGDADPSNTAAMATRADPALEPEVIPGDPAGIIVNRFPNGDPLTKPLTIDMQNQTSGAVMYASQRGPAAVTDADRVTGPITVGDREDVYEYPLWACAVAEGRNRSENVKWIFKFPVPVPPFISYFHPYNNFDNPGANTATLPEGVAAGRVFTLTMTLGQGASQGDSIPFSIDGGPTVDGPCLTNGSDEFAFVAATATIEFTLHPYDAEGIGCVGAGAPISTSIIITTAPDGIQVVQDRVAYVVAPGETLELAPSSDPAVFCELFLTNMPTPSTINSDGDWYATANTFDHYTLDNYTETWEIICGENTYYLHNTNPTPRPGWFPDDLVDSWITDDPLHAIGVDGSLVPVIPAILLSSGAVVGGGTTRGAEGDPSGAFWQGQNPDPYGGDPALLWVELDLGQNYELSKYEMGVPTNDTEGPVEWTVTGWADGERGEAGTLLDTQSGHTADAYWGVPDDIHEFTLASPVTCRYVRVLMGHSHYGGQVVLNYLSFYGVPA